MENPRNVCWGTIHLVWLFNLTNIQINLFYFIFFYDIVLTSWHVRNILINLWNFCRSTQWSLSNNNKKQNQKVAKGHQPHESYGLILTPCRQAQSKNEHLFNFALKRRVNRSNMIILTFITSQLFHITFNAMRSIPLSNELCRYKPTLLPQSIRLAGLPKQ